MKPEARKAMLEATNDAALEADMAAWDELDFAWYCYNFGPCPKCREEMAEAYPELMALDPHKGAS